MENQDIDSVEIELNTVPKTRIKAMYNPPSIPTDQIINYFETSLQTKTNLLIIGDININLLNKNRVTGEYMDILETNGFKILNKVDEDNATRIQGQAISIIDHIITNMENTDCKISIEDSYLSDHRQISMLINFHKVELKPMVTKKNMIMYKNVQTELKEALENVKEEDITFQLIADLIARLKDKWTHKKIFRSRQNEWITEVITAIKLKNKLYKKMKKSPKNIAHRTDYKNQKNLVNKLVTQTKTQYVSNEFIKAGNDSRKFWKVINSTLNKVVLRKNKEIDLLVKEGKTITNNKEKANVMNQYFTTIGEKIADRIKADIGTRKIDKIYPTSNGKSMMLIPVDQNEVKETIDSLKDVSPGYDGITTKDVKKLKDVIANPIHKIINKSFVNGNFPTELKKAIICPIYKAGDTTNPENY